MGCRSDLVIVFAFGVEGRKRGSKCIILFNLIHEDVSKFQNFMTCIDMFYMMVKFFKINFSNSIILGFLHYFFDFLILLAPYLYTVLQMRLKEWNVWKVWVMMCLKDLSLLAKCDTVSKMSIAPHYSKCPQSTKKIPDTYGLIQSKSYRAWKRNLVLMTTDILKKEEVISKSSSVNFAIIEKIHKSNC